jgi:hypothetical protein
LVSKKKILLRNLKKAKTGCNLAKFSKEGSVSKKAVLPVMMMMMMNFSLSQ